MKIHKEGYPTIIIVFVFLLIINLLAFWGLSDLSILPIIISIVSIGFFFFIIQFFRSPNRELIPPDDNIIYSPADGKIVVIEQVQEKEYFNDERLQISIFMSPLNVHVNYFPVKGKVKYYKYHKGKYLVAWHPKSSSLNERTTVVIEKEDGTEIMVRQIAGAVARRVVCYAEEGKNAEQGDQLGFIKFGSRVDVFLPLDAKPNVQIQQEVFGNQTMLGTFSTV